MNRIRVAIQKSGRLSDHSLELLQSCGLRFARSKDKLYWYGKDFPIDLLLVRDDDIPRLLLDRVCELGIVGENIAEEVVLERNKRDGLTQLRKLSFGGCHLSLAVPEDSQIKSASELEGCRIATSYPALTSSLLSQRGIDGGNGQVFRFGRNRTGSGNGGCDIGSRFHRYDITCQPPG